MYFEYRDFNHAEEYFGGEAEHDWIEIGSVLDGLVPQLQPSDQKGKQGSPIFDPKSTNACLTLMAADRGWRNIVVPKSLQVFGVDFDAGKNATLVEWQFSNYPFLWNNVIRSEAIFKSDLKLAGMKKIRALIMVTKGGCFPASNSTLYYEQARSQLDVVTDLGVFDIPIRLVGLMIEPSATELEASWNVYGARYVRDIGAAEVKRFAVAWKRSAKYDHMRAELSPLEPVNLPAQGQPADQIGQPLEQELF
ncbi:hypothetical protein AB0875_11810 [Micromonospora gifhornensis]|uniref:hypothetical protein n=1 Tax=Micromonospora gifhornensis TaxID=84594 RepID=UPI0034527C85